MNTMQFAFIFLGIGLAVCLVGYWASQSRLPIPRVRSRLLRFLPFFFLIYAVSGGIFAFFGYRAAELTGGILGSLFGATIALIFTLTIDDIERNRLT